MRIFKRKPCYFGTASIYILVKEGKSVGRIEKYIEKYIWGVEMIWCVVLKKKKKFILLSNVESLDL